MIDPTAHIDPHWPVDASDAAREQPSLPLDLGPAQPRRTVRAIRARLAEAPPIGEEFDLLRELRRRARGRQ